MNKKLGYTLKSYLTLNMMQYSRNLKYWKYSQIVNGARFWNPWPFLICMSSFSLTKMSSFSLTFHSRFFLIKNISIKICFSHINIQKKKLLQNTNSWDVSYIVDFLTKKYLEYKIQPNFSFNKMKTLVKFNTILNEISLIRKLKQQKHLKNYLTNHYNKYLWLKCEK